MNKSFRLKIVQNRNISLLGVHIGMEKDAAVIVLKNFSPHLCDAGISIPNTKYGITYALDKYGFVCGINISICDNGADDKEVEEFTEFHKKLLQSNFALMREDEKIVNEEKKISEYYSSGILKIDFFVDRNVKALLGRNSALIVVKFTLGRDFLHKPLEGKSLAESLYSLLRVDVVPIKRKFVFKLPFQYAKYILLVILVLACMFIYAFSHRYQVVANGRAIIDKWAGTIEEVEYKK